MRHTRAIDKTAKMHREAKKRISVKAYWTLKSASPPRICHDALFSSARSRAKGGEKQGTGEREVVTRSMRGTMCCPSNLWLSRASRGSSSSHIYVQSMIQLFFFLFHH